MTDYNPIPMFLQIGAAIMIVLVIGVSYQVRAEIGSFLVSCFRRYYPERKSVNTYHRAYDDAELEVDNNILSSLLHNDAKTPDTVPVSVPVPVVEVPPPASDNDIIDYLAKIKLDGKIDYRFSGNKIYDFVGGKRNDVMKRISTIRNEVQPTTPPAVAPEPPAPAKPEPYTGIVRMWIDPEHPGRMRSIRKDEDGREFYVDEDTDQRVYVKEELQPA